MSFIIDTVDYSMEGKRCQRKREEIGEYFFSCFLNELALEFALFICFKNVFNNDDWSTRFVKPDAISRVVRKGRGSPPCTGRGARCMMAP